MHKAKACVISCMDFRIQKFLQEYLQLNGYLGYCDEITIAGATRDFIKPLTPEHEAYAWRQLDLSVKLHNPDEIIFVDHQDCGGYAQDHTIENDLDEKTDKNQHKKYLPVLIERFTQKYPEKALRIFYITLDGNVEILY